MKKYLSVGILTLLFSLLISYSDAQIRVQYSGLEFILTPNISITEMEKGELLGSYNYRVTIHSFNSRLNSSFGIYYKSKQYNYEDFNGELKSYFNALNVTAAGTTVEVNGLKDCSNFSYAVWKEGEHNNKSCTPINGSKVSTTNIKISSLIIDGLAELRNKIDALEQEEKKRAAEEAEEKKRKEEEDKRIEDEKLKAEQEKKILDEAKQKENKLKEDEAKQKLTNQQSVATKTSQLTEAEKQKLVEKEKNDKLLAAKKLDEENNRREKERQLNEIEAKKKREENKKLADSYDSRLQTGFSNAKLEFQNLSPEVQKKRCEEAEGLAELASLRMEEGGTSGLFARAAYLCPTNPKAETWIIYSSTSYETSLNSYEFKKRAEELDKFQRQNLAFSEAMNKVSYNSYNQYLIEKEHDRLVEKSRTTLQQFTNKFQKISEVNVKFSDPNALFKNIDERIRLVEANLAQAYKAAGQVATDEMNKTYTQTGSASTAAKVGAVHGAAALIASELNAASARKELKNERDSQLHEIYNEYYIDLENRIENAVNKLIKSQSEDNDRKYFSELIYSQCRLNYIKANYQYGTTSTEWFYNNSCAQNSGYDKLKFYYIDDDQNLQVAQRKLKIIMDASLLEPSLYYKLNYKLKDEAKVYIANTLKYNPQSANAYYLYSQLTAYQSEKFQHLFVATKLAKNEPHLLPIKSKLKSDFSVYLKDVINKNKIGEFESVIYNRLHVNILGPDFDSFVRKLIAEDKGDFISYLIKHDPAFQKKEIQKQIAIESIKQNNTAIIEKLTLTGFDFANTFLTVTGQNISLSTFALTQNSSSSFVQTAGKLNDFSKIEHEIKKFKLSVLDSFMYNGLLELALYYDYTKPLEFIKIKNIKYFKNNPSIITDAASKWGTVNVVDYLITNKLANTERLSASLFTTNDIGVIASLLKFGVNPNILNSKGEPLLISKLDNQILEKRRLTNSNKREDLIKNYQISKADNQLVALLSHYKYDFFATDNNGDNAIHAAVQYGDFELLKRICNTITPLEEQITSIATKNKGEPTELTRAINQKNNKGKTPLHIAIIQNNYPIIQLLLKLGANTRISDNDNLNAIQWAKKVGLKLPNVKELNILDLKRIIFNEVGNIPTLINNRDIKNIFTYLSPIQQPSTKRNTNQDSVVFKSKEDFKKSKYFNSKEFSEVIKHNLLLKTIGVWTVTDLNEFEEVIPIQDYNNKLNNSFLCKIKLKSLENPNNTFECEIEINYWLSETGQIFLESNYRQEYFAKKMVLSKIVYPNHFTMLYAAPRVYKCSEYKNGSICQFNILAENNKIALAIEVNGDKIKNATGTTISVDWFESTEEMKKFLFVKSKTKEPVKVILKWEEN